MKIASFFLGLAGMLAGNGLAEANDCRLVPASLDQAAYEVQASGTLDHREILAPSAGPSTYLPIQWGSGGRLWLSANESFDRNAYSAGGVASGRQIDGDVNKGLSFEYIGGLVPYPLGTEFNRYSRILWPVYSQGPQTVVVRLFLEYARALEPTSATELHLRFGGQNHVCTLPSTQEPGIPLALQASFSLPDLGTYQYLEFHTPSGDPQAVRVYGASVEGQGLAVVRARWRPRAVYAAFSSSNLADDSAIDAWILEYRTSPQEGWVYAPFSAPFGYFGCGFLADGTASVLNFSMWSRRAGSSPIPVGEESHLLVLGSQDAAFGHFSHEGSGAKVRNWNPFTSLQSRYVIALVLDDQDPEAGMYRSYFFDEATDAWRLYAVGRQPNRPIASLWTRGFMEVPGSAATHRVAPWKRELGQRAWVRSNGRWHFRDRMISAPKGDFTNGRWAADDDFFLRSLGGLEHQRREDIPEVVELTEPPTPNFMQAEQLLGLEALPLEIEVSSQALQGRRMRVQVGAPGITSQSRVEIYWGPEDRVVETQSWPNSGTIAPDELSYLLPEQAAGARTYYRVYIEDERGKAFSFSTRYFDTPQCSPQNPCLLNWRKVEVPEPLVDAAVAGGSLQLIVGSGGTVYQASDEPPDLAAPNWQPIAETDLMRAEVAGRFLLGVNQRGGLWWSSLDLADLRPRVAIDGWAETLLFGGGALWARNASGHLYRRDGATVAHALTARWVYEFAGALDVGVDSMGRLWALGQDEAGPLWLRRWDPATQDWRESSGPMTTAPGLALAMTDAALWVLDTAGRIYRSELDASDGWQEINPVPDTHPVRLLGAGQSLFYLSGEGELFQLETFDSQ